MARYRCTSPPPLAALAVLLLICVSFHCAAAAARPLPAAPLVIHSGTNSLTRSCNSTTCSAALISASELFSFFLAESGVKDDADGMVLQEGAAGNGEELSVSEVRGRTQKLLHSVL
jgi:hypothetical protein